MKNSFVLPALAGLLFLSAAHGDVAFTNDFSSDPMQAGWQIHGDTNLFLWDQTNQNLAVTWDSSLPNSYFYQPLGVSVSKDDNFAIMFDLRLDDIGPGSDTNKPFSFNLSIGLLNHGEATQPGFLRGTGVSSPDLAEFSYFWDSGFGATVWPVLVDSNSGFNFSSFEDYAIYELNNGDWYRVVMKYTGANHALVTTLTNLTDTTGIVIHSTLDSFFTDFNVDTLSISSFNDTDGFGGSLLARGAVDNVAVSVTLAPIKKLTGGLSNNVWQANFVSQTNWLYTLERTTNFVSWSDSSPVTPGTPGTLTLSDTNPPTDGAFYRVRAERP